VCWEKIFQKVIDLLLVWPIIRVSVVPIGGCVGEPCVSVETVKPTEHRYGGCFGRWARCPARRYGAEELRRPSWAWSFLRLSLAAVTAGTVHIRMEVILGK
jgi:hypothetical protein